MASLPFTSGNYTVGNRFETHILNHLQHLVSDLFLRDCVQVVRVVIGVEEDVVLRTVLLRRVNRLGMRLVIENENHLTLFVQKTLRVKGRE